MSNTNTITINVKKTGEGDAILTTISIGRDKKISELINKIKNEIPFQNIDKIIFDAK